MSILLSSLDGYVVCHELFIKEMYKNVREDDTVFDLSFNKDVFGIDIPFDERGNYTLGLSRKKFKCSSGEELAIQNPEINEIQNKFFSLLRKARSKGYLKNVTVLKSGNQNVKAKERADQFYKESSKYLKTSFHGCNNLSSPVIQKFNNELYVFPCNSTFFCHDVEKLKEMLIPSGETFDLIVLDPPWWNKYIRRKKSKCTEASYEMMYNDNLKNLPISQLMSDNALVAVWCTNSKQNINAVLNNVFPSWKVKYTATWFWVKVTNSGDPICAFADLPKKQPYERILFAYNKKRKPFLPLPEDGKIIISVPSAIHSHKPPLSDILSSFLPCRPSCLELFARYLLPNWTSWGNEVLKLQHTSLYERSL